MAKSFADTVNFISKLSVRKVYNGLKILISFYYSKFTGKTQIWGMPVSIAFEPTTSCNLRCPECPSGLRSFTRPTGMLQSDLFEKYITEISPYLCNLTFYFQGEPYLNPDFLKMVQLADKQNVYTSTSTNAHYLDDEKAKLTVESGLDRLIISIDGTTQETYEQYRVGGQLEKVLAGARKMVEWKKKLKSNTPHLVFQFLVVKPNQHQIEEVKQLAKEIGVDQVVFKTAQIYDFEHGSDLMTDIDHFSRYRKMADGTYEIKSNLDNQCWKMWHSCVITWDGKVVPCCFDKDAHYQLGNLKEVDFQSVWKGFDYQNFRGLLLKSRKEIDICKNCTEGAKVFG